MSTERIPNDAFGGFGGPDDANLPGQETPRLEGYQTPAGNLRIEEAQGPTGAWIEIEIRADRWTGGDA